MNRSTCLNLFKLKSFKLKLRATPFTQWKSSIERSISAIAITKGLEFWKFAFQANVPHAKANIYYIAITKVVQEGEALIAFAKN